MVVTVALEGFHAVKHALRFAPELVDQIVVADLSLARILADRLAPDIADLLLERATVAPVQHPTGVRASASRTVDDRTVLSVRSSPLVLLDEPRQAGNAGAAIRASAAAGASGLVSTGDLDPWHPTVVRGSAGLHFALPVLRLASTEIGGLLGPVLILDGDGEDLRPADLPDDAILVVGSERAGVGAAMRSRADAVVRLPMRPGVSSLNLATAVAAALYAWRLRSP